MKDRLNDDALRERLAQLDPNPASVPVDPITSPRAQDLLERTMTTDLDAPTHRPTRRPTRLIALSAAAAAALVAGGAALLAGGDDTPTTTGKKTTLALALPDPLAMSSCIPFDVEVLKDMPVAFAGTVTSVVGDTVALDVTHWYRGGSAAVVTLDTPGDSTSPSLDSVAFAAGKDYLVTAAEGNVNGCGFSGEATDDLTRAFDQAFPG